MTQPEETIDFNEIDVLRLTVTDVHGQQRTCRHCVSSLEETVAEGCEVFAGTILHGPLSEDVELPAINNIRCGNVTVVPVRSTLRVLPWTAPLRVAEVLCETRLLHPEVKRGQPQPEATRYIARRLVDDLRREFDFELRSAFEFEFVDLSDTLGRACATTLGCVARERFLSDACKQMRSIGVNINAFSREYAAGQYEMNQEPARGVDVADQAVRFKCAIKEIFAPDMITFMPKHSYTECCNGLHYNFSLLQRNGANAFLDATNRDRLSETAYHWLAGLIHHAPALSTLCNPTVNCYRRLHNEWTAGLAYWDVDDRHASFRVRNSNDNTFVESRVPSGAANPYLVVASHVAAGLDGLRRKLECPPRRDHAHCGRLPRTLELGLKALEEDSVMVEALGSEFIEAFCIIKRSIELEKLSSVDVLRKPTCQSELEEERKLYLVHI